jgi:hypothetical protein
VQTAAFIDQAGIQAGIRTDIDARIGRLRDRIRWAAESGGPDQAIYRAAEAELAAAHAVLDQGGRAVLLRLLRARRLLGLVDDAPPLAEAASAIATTIAGSG